MADYLLLETGDKLILESGTGDLLLESSSGSSTTNRLIGGGLIGDGPVQLVQSGE